MHVSSTDATRRVGSAALVELNAAALPTQSPPVSLSKGQLPSPPFSGTVQNPCSLPKAPVLAEGGAYAVIHTAFSKLFKKPQPGCDQDPPFSGLGHEQLRPLGARRWVAPTRFERTASVKVVRWGICAVASCALSIPAAAQVSHMDRPILNATPTKVSEHVWQITGFPNVAIIVGSRATLVVDTGLGPSNGKTVARAAAKIAPPKSKLFLTTTHFHPEHAFGEAGFPPNTIIIRNIVQQREMDEQGPALVELFRDMTPLNRRLLKGAVSRSPDVTFERELRVDLGGGVAARLLWLGSAHTKGDQLVFVEPDRTLISGDVVQNKTAPFIYGEGGTASSWIAAIDEAAKLGPLHVLPDHSPPGDGSMLDESRAFLVHLRQRALEMKQLGLDVDQAGKSLTIEFKVNYKGWEIDDLTSFVKATFSE